jgi:predicted TIM-barrel fold metal-dependent hydrolase
MIIDCHVHLFPDRLADAVRAWFDANAWSINYRETAAANIERLRSGGIDRAVALPYVHKPGIAEALNSFTLELARQSPLVVPCCTVFPGEEGAERIVDEALGTQGFAGIKIHCHVMRVGADDPRLDQVWRASARYRKPVMIHAGPEPAASGYGFDVRPYSGFERVRRALERHPDAIAIVPHLGFDQFAQFEALLDEFPNLYLDTTMAIAGYFPAGPDLEILRRRPGRILYGTDFPNLPYDWSRELGVIRGLKLSAETEAALLGNTAARLFGIETN